MPGTPQTKNIADGLGEMQAKECEHDRVGEQNLIRRRVVHRTQVVIFENYFVYEEFSAYLVGC